MKEEYRVIKDWIDGKIDEAASLAKLKAETTTLFKESYIEHLREYHQTLMEKVAELSTRALKEWGLSLLIFPEGTRSIRLGEGRIGIAQIALYSGKKIIIPGLQQLRHGLHGPFALCKNGRHHLSHRRAAHRRRQAQGVSHHGTLQAFFSRDPSRNTGPSSRESPGSSWTVLTACSTRDTGDPKKPQGKKIPLHPPYECHNTLIFLSPGGRGLR